KEEAIQFKQVIEVITNVSKKSGKRELLPVKNLRTKAVTIKSKISKRNKKSTEADHRRQLIYNTASNNLYTPAPVIEGEEEKLLIPFTKKLENIEGLKKQLELINKFIDAYRLFTVQNDPRVQSR